MAEINFKIEGQHIFRTDVTKVVADSRNYLYANFIFSDDWKGIKTAIFENNKTVVNVILENDSCLVPWEVIKEGRLNISVICGDLITADVCSLTVYKSGYKEGETPSEPTPSVYEQIIEQLDDVKHITEEEIAEKVEIYFEEHHDEFKGDKGDAYEITEDDYEAIADVVEQRTREPIEALETKIDKTQRSLDYLWKKSKGIVYDTETVESLADADVPSGAMEYAELQTVGGVSRKGRNLLDQYNNTSKTVSGLTITINDDNTILINGTAEADVDYPFVVNNETNIKWNVGEVYRLVGCPIGGSNSTYRINAPYQTNNTDYGDGATITIATENYVQIRILIANGTVCNNLLFKPMLSKDLTVTYDDYEPYTPTLIDAKVNEVVSRGRNLFNSTNVLDSTNNGIKYTVLSDGRLSVIGTATKNERKMLIDASSNILDAGSYSISGCPSGGGNTVYRLYAHRADAGVSTTIANDIGNGATFTLNEKANVGLIFYVEEGVSVNFTISPMLELGTTATTYTPYRTPITTPIPQSILDLPDYGIGVSADCYNYVDFKEKKYHRRVKSVSAIATGNVSDVPQNEGNIYGVPLNSLDDMRVANYGLGLCNLYINTGAKTMNSIRFGANNNSVYVYLSEEFKGMSKNDYQSYLDEYNAILYYELAEEEIIDISDLLTDEDFNILSVEAGGRVEFNYPNKAEYKCSTPNRIEYMVEVDKV